MTRNRVTCLIMLIFMAGIYIWTNVKLSFWLLILMIVLIVLALLSNLAGMRRFSVETVTAGKDDKTDGSGANGRIVLRLRNASVFPLFRVKISLVMRNLLTGSSYSTEEVFFMLPREQREEVINIESLYIGRVETDITGVEGSDAFGLSRAGGKALSRGCFEKYPETGIMRKDLDRSASESIKSMDRYLHRRGNDPSEVLDIREYQRGDNVKRIHWKLTAKLKTTMVRELDMPSDQDTLVIFGLEDASNGLLIHKVVSCALNVSWNLLREDVHHSFILLDEGGGLLQNFDVTSDESYIAMEERVLAGSISVSAEDMNAYLESAHIVSQYSHIFYVTDALPERRLSEDIEYITPEDE